MKQPFLSLLCGLVFYSISGNLNAQSLPDRSENIFRGDTLPKEKMCDIKAYSDEVMFGIYKSAYGIDLYSEFPAFPRFVSTGNNHTDKVLFLEKVDAFIQNNAEFRRKIGMPN